jgi:hypothetical protein
VCVLHDDQRGHHQHSLEERRHRRLKPMTASLGVEGVDLGRGGRLRVERHGEKRKPRGEIGHRGGHERRELRACDLARGLRDDPDELPERVAPGSVRHGARVLLADEVHLSETESMGARHGDEA